MKIPKIASAMDYLDDELIDEAIGSNERKKKVFNFKIFWTVAASIAIIAGLLLTAEATNGGVSNALAPLFNMAQTELVDDVGVPVGVSATADGYTLTADAAIGDRYNVAVVYTLTRDDGQPIPEIVTFNNWNSDLTNKVSGAGGSLHRVADKDHPNKMHFVETWSVSGSIFNRYITVDFSDLEFKTENGDWETIAEGPWELSYTLRYKDSTIKVPAVSTKVTDIEGKEYIIKKIQLSPFGIHIDGKWLHPVMGEDNNMHCFSVKICKTDGEIIELEDRNIRWGFGEKSKAARFDYSAMFPEPILTDNVESLIICDTEFPVK